MPCEHLFFFLVLHEMYHFLVFSVHLEICFGFSLSRTVGSKMLIIEWVCMVRFEYSKRFSYWFIMQKHMHASAVYGARQFAQNLHIGATSLLSLFIFDWSAFVVWKLLTPADRRLKVMRRNFKWKILKTNKLLKHGFVFHFNLADDSIFFLFSLILTALLHIHFTIPSGFGVSSFHRRAGGFAMCMCVCVLLRSAKHYLLFVYMCEWMCGFEHAFFSLAKNYGLQVEWFKCAVLLQ